MKRCIFLPAVYAVTMIIIPSVHGFGDDIFVDLFADSIDNSVQYDSADYNSTMMEYVRESIHAVNATSVNGNLEGDLRLIETNIRMLNEMASILISVNDTTVEDSVSHLLQHTEDVMKPQRAAVGREIEDYKKEKEGLISSIASANRTDVPAIRGSIVKVEENLTFALQQLHAVDDAEEEAAPRAVHAQENQWKNKAEHYLQLAKEKCEQVKRVGGERAESGAELLQLAAEKARLHVEVAAERLASRLLHALAPKIAILRQNLRRYEAKLASNNEAPFFVSLNTLSLDGNLDDGIFRRATIFSAFSGGMLFAFSMVVAVLWGRKNLKSHSEMPKINAEPLLYREL